MRKPDLDAVDLCTTCEEERCVGGHKGCPFERKHGLKYSPAPLYQHQCGVPEPFAKTERMRPLRRRKRVAVQERALMR